MSGAYRKIILFYMCNVNSTNVNMYFEIGCIPKRMLVHTWERAKFLPINGPKSIDKFPISLEVFVIITTNRKCYRLKVVDLVVICVVSGSLLLTAYSIVINCNFAL